ncbi:MAG TPA: hypothetical protein VF989_17315, partial [Polyangiaceae bacterium]
MIRASNLLAAALACGAAACGDDERFYNSAHFRYHLRSPDTERCPGIVHTLERHFAIVSEYFGLPEPRQVIDYYKFRDTEHLQESGACPKLAQACAEGRNLDV